MRLRKLAVWAVVAGFSGPGCSSASDVDIGDGRSGQKLTDYAAAWTGYAEAHEFVDGSDTLQLVLDANGEGTLTVGDSSPPDPHSVSPPTPGSSDGLTAGFAYGVKWAVVEESRLRFMLQPTEAFGGWCAEQPPIIFDAAQLPGYYACVPNAASGTEGDKCWIQPEGEAKQYIDCGAYEACDGGGVCACSAEACGVPEFPREYAEGFELWDTALEGNGNSLVGTFAALSVRLKRQ